MNLNLDDTIRNSGPLMTVLKLPINMSQLLGVFITLTPSTISSAFPRIVLTILVFVLYAYATTMLIIEEPPTFISGIVSLGNYSRAAILVVIQYEMYVRKRYLLNCVRKLRSIEHQELSRGSMGELYIVKRTAIRLTFQAVAVFLDFWPRCSKRTSWYSAVNYVFINYVSLFFFSVWNIFICFVNFANEEFQIITSQLTTSNVKRAYEADSTEYHHLIKKHAVICWAVDDLMLWFERSFVAYAAFYFYFTTYNLYQISRDVYSLIEHPTLCIGVHLAAYCIWVGMRSAEIWSIISSCHEVEQSSQYFTTRLHETMKQRSYVDKEEEQICKLHFLVKPKVECWANGYFKLDNSLIHSMAAAAATYLAVLYQTIDISESV